jgi:hypothetical protein
MKLTERQEREIAIAYLQKIRNKNLTKEQRSEIGRKAANARWRRVRKNQKDSPCVASASMAD